MENETYTLLDAMREEISFLKEMEAYYKEQDTGLFRKVAIEEQRQSLNRILNRFEKGIDYYLGINQGKTTIMLRPTTRHLEREYPAVAKAKQNLDTVVDLTKGKDNA